MDFKRIFSAFDPVEILYKFRRGLLPVFGGLGKQAGDQKRQIFRAFFVEAVHIPGDILDMLHSVAGNRRSRERGYAGQHLVSRAAQRIQIGTVINVSVPGMLFRTHIRRGADKLARCRQNRI